MSSIRQFQDHDDPEYEARVKAKLDKALKKTERSVPGFFIKNYRFTYLIVFAIVAMGVYSLLTLPREAEPEVRVPFAVVNTVYPGATPTDIEDLVTNKIEEKVKDLDNLSVFTSSSGENFSSVFVEFNAEADLKDSFQKLREAVDEVGPKLPDEAETPVVTEVNFNDFPIVTYSLVGDYTDVELKKFADILQDELEDVTDVSEVNIIGGLEREFQVIVSQTKLASFNFSLAQVVGAIQSSNFSLPSGDIEIDGFKYGVRITGKVEKARDLNDIVIATFQDSPVFLRDVARVIDGYKEKVTESRIGFGGNGVAKNTISLQVFKRTGGNILDIAKNSQIKIDELAQNNILPDNLEILKTNDNSVFIRDDLETLGFSGLQTFVLITLILMLVLSFRGALITALSVPIAFLMAFIFLNVQGMTINSMVLFSLVLSLGLMVDNAIVINEGINEYVTEHKRPIYEAAILSVWNFKWPITAGTMTTVAAFVPMLLVSGIMGEYMGILPKTISFTLLSSLFVAIVVIPTLATRFVKRSLVGERKHHRHKKRHFFIADLVKKLQKKYAEFLKNTLPDKKKRRRVIATAWVLFIIAVAVPITGLMEIEMFPDIDMEYFVINIELPAGSTLEKSRMIASQAETIVAQIPELDNYVTNVGAAMSLGYGEGASTGSNLASITVNLSDKDERKRKSYQVADSIRADLEAIQGARVTVEELTAGPPSGAPIEVRILGNNTKDLTIVAQDITDFLETVPGVINIKDSIEDSTGEFNFIVDKQKANFYGLSIASVASTLRNAIYGTTASTVNLAGEDDDVDITVKYDKETFNNVSDLENILLFTPTGENITLKEVAQVSLEPSLKNIQHRDGEKIVTVSADLGPDGSLKDALAEFNKFKETIELPENFSIKVGGEVEDIQKSFKELFLSMIISILLIAVILVLQFNSFRQPFLILFSLPLAIIGVMVGLNIIGHPFSFTVFIGLVSLSGIVVNDSIVLVDRINKNIADGMEFYKAIIDGGLARMQPIFLTSLTTIAGIFPLIYANEIWRGLSLTVIFGLMFSTILILVVIPVYYAGMCYKEKCR